MRGAALLVGLDALDAEPAQDLVGAGEQVEALEQAVGDSGRKALSSRLPSAGGVAMVAS